MFPHGHLGKGRKKSNEGKNENESERRKSNVDENNWMGRNDSKLFG